jgi:predicted nucleic acid-binding protein
VIVLDASVLIAHLDGRDVHHEKAARLLIDTGAEALAASTISLAETLVAPARAGRLAEAKEALERLGVAELYMGHGGPSRLAQLRADTGCKLPDCCVLLAAQEHEGTVASFDVGLTKAAAALGLSTVEPRS